MVGLKVGLLGWLGHSKAANSVQPLVDSMAYLRAGLKVVHWVLQ